MNIVSFFFFFPRYVKSGSGRLRKGKGANRNTPPLLHINRFDTQSTAAFPEVHHLYTSFPSIQLIISHTSLQWPNRHSSAVPSDVQADAEGGKEEMQSFLNAPKIYKSLIPWSMEDLTKLKFILQK